MTTSTDPIPTVFVAYVTGDEGIYDEIIADSVETAIAVAELEFDDYFGEPIRWGETPIGGSIAKTGTFHEDAQTTRHVIIAQRTVWTMHLVEEQRSLR
jgi:hypothetical protein